ncbi:MAG: hypothetical protein AB8B56_04680 [Crocinitomicaceae bacterium]
MRPLIFLIAFYTSSTSFSQKIVDKQYVLIDSFDLFTLSSADSSIIADRLNRYHNTSGVVQRLVKLSELSNALENAEVRMAYSKKALSKIRSFLKTRASKLTQQ